MILPRDLFIPPFPCRTRFGIVPKDEEKSRGPLRERRNDDGGASAEDGREFAVQIAVQTDPGLRSPNGELPMHFRRRPEEDFARSGMIDEGLRDCFSVAFHIRDNIGDEGADSGKSLVVAFCEP